MWYVRDVLYAVLYVRLSCFVERGCGVEGMSVVANVMVSLMRVVSIVQPIGMDCCKVMYFGCFGLRGELGFLNCDVCRE